MSGQTWQEKATFMTPTFEVHEVAGKKMNFYPVSVGMAFRLRRLAAPLVEAVTELFAERGAATHLVQENTEETGKESTVRHSKIVSQPMALEMMQYREQKRKESLTKILSALEDEQLYVLAAIIMDSLREVFPSQDPLNPTPAEFTMKTPLPVLPDLVVGTIKANKGVLNPLKGVWSPWLEQVTRQFSEAAKKRIDQMTAEAGKGEASTQEDGNTSKTELSEQSAPGSQKNSS